MSTASTWGSGTGDTKVWKLGIPPDGKQIHMGRVSKMEKEPCDLLVGQPLSEERVVLVEKQVSNDNCLPGMWNAAERPTD